MQTADQLAFQENGFVRIPRAFSREQAAAMEERVWGWLERRYGVSRAEPASWKGLQPTGLQGLKRQAVFDAIGSPVTCAALDALLGAGRWKKPRDWGGFLVSFPVPGGWAPGHGWHTDFGFQGPLDRPFGALVLSFLSDVPPGAGGTVVVEGSHRVVRQFLVDHPRARAPMKSVRQALLKSDPWLAALAVSDEDPGRAERLMREGALVAGVPVRVVELAGEAGDLVIGHNWLLHAGAPNRGSRPRIMRVQRVQAA